MSLDVVLSPKSHIYDDASIVLFKNEIISEESHEKVMSRF